MNRYKKCFYLHSTSLLSDVTGHNTKKHSKTGEKLECQKIPYCNDKAKCKITKKLFKKLEKKMRIYGHNGFHFLQIKEHGDFYDCNNYYKDKLLFKKNGFEKCQFCISDGGATPSFKHKPRKRSQKHITKHKALVGKKIEKEQEEGDQKILDQISDYMLTFPIKAPNEINKEFLNALKLCLLEDDLILSIISIEELKEMCVDLLNKRKKGVK